MNSSLFRDISQNPEPLKDQKYWADRSIKSAERLETLETKEPDQPIRGNLLARALKLYGYKKKERKSLSLQQQMDLVSAHVNHDYLIINLFAPDGQKTALAKNTYPLVDPDDYRYSGLIASTAVDLLKKTILEKERGATDQSYIDEYAGVVIVTANGEAKRFNPYLDDVVHAYNQMFGHENQSQPVISIPGRVDVDEDCISISTARDFLPPYGNDSHDRTIFVKANG